MDKKKLLTLIIFSLLIYNCSNEKNIYKNSARYQSKSFSKEYGDCGPLSHNCVSVKINYPYFTWALSDPAKDSLNHLVGRMILQPLFEYKVQSPEELSDSLINDYKRLKKDFPDSPGRYELERNVNIHLNQNEIISIEFSEYSYMAGAHPNSLRIFSNLHLLTAQKISLDELFKKGFEEKLNLIGEKKFREARLLKPDDDLEKSGFWFKDNKFAVNNNFLITNTELKLYFNDYEVAPHSVGPTELFILYKEIKNILNPIGLLGPFIK